MVAISCFGALNGMVSFPIVLLSTIDRSLNTGSFFTSGRLIYAAGREGYLPALFGRLHQTRQTPLNAMCLQATITILFIILGGGFRSLINFAVVASWAFYFLTVLLSSREFFLVLMRMQVLGLVILRIKEPMLKRYF